MPILQYEPELYPDNLFEAEFASREVGNWWALRTRSRHEKDLVRYLRAAEIGCYCPVIERRTRSPAGRRRTSFVPLFGGYVFALCDEAARLRSLGSNAVVQCLPVADGARLYDDLRQIWTLISSGEDLTPEASLVPGQRVKVRSGSLAGVEGTIVKRQGANRLIVTVNFLQQGASVLLEDCDVIPL
jgi:transcriptional antiterminator RfaH